MAASCAQAGPADGAASASPAGAVLGIVEHKDASPAQRQIREVYTGMMAAPTALLRRWVMALTDDNAQREFYLTDIVAMAVAEGVPVVASQASRRDRGAGRQQPAATGRPGAPLPAPPGRRPAGRRRAPGRPGALRPARHAGHRQRRRHRRGLRLRGHGHAGRRCAHRRALRHPRRGDRQRHGDPPLHPHRRRQAWARAR